MAIHTYIHDIQQKKRREKVKNEGNSVLIIGGDERDISRSCGAC